MGKTYFPPKPLLISLDQPLFDELEMRKDVAAELKYNGTRLILKRIVDEDGTHTGVMLKPYYEFWNRHGERLKYEPNSALLKQLDGIPWEGDCVLDGELMHFKTKKVKNTVVLWDVYMWGESTLNLPLESRRELLAAKLAVFPVTVCVSDKVTISQAWEGGEKGRFRDLFEKFTKLDDIEGLVIKSLKAKVTLGRNGSPVVPGAMWKVRRTEVSKNGMKRIRF